MTDAAGPGTGRDADGDTRHEIDRVFCLALDLPEAERQAFVEAECARQPAQSQAVLRLLAAERASQAVFEHGAASNVRAMRDLLHEPLADDPHVGQRLGPYRLVRRIGQGGMAVVYLGEREDGQFTQQVAVKLLRRTVDAADQVARFKTERQILSALAHPNIAGLIDGGATADGLPYLVTEYIEGLAITEYCGEHGLGVPARLDLFLQMTDAVQHAHQKLVVHRDLKPSNVMVDASGRVRLLDFGIAKLLDASGQLGQAPLTRLGQAVMTPEYAAPEQLAGGEITTATDIYQLGVLLHELLTGVRPDRAPTGPDALTAGTVSRPSTRVPREAAALTPPLERKRLVRCLRGDLDIIVMTALQPDPARRYASVAMLAADIRSHLRGRPIVARPDSAIDLLRRLARRSPWAVAASALVLVLLVGWLISLQSHARALALERDAAAAQAQRATRANELLLGVFRRADPLMPDSVGGHDATLWASLDAAVDNIRATLKDEPETRVELLSSLARLYHASGALDRARALLQEVLAHQRQGAVVGSAAVAVTLAELGSVESDAGNHGAAAAHLAQAVDIARQLPAAAAGATAPVFLDAGHAAIHTGDAAAALRHFEDAQTSLDAAPNPDPNARIETLFGRGNALIQLGDLPGAEALILESVRQTELLYGADHARLCGPLSALGNVQRRLGKLQQSTASLRRAIVILERVYGDKSRSVLVARANLALTLGQAGEHAAAQGELRQLVVLNREVFGEVHVVVANAYQNLGASYAKGGEPARALAALGEARRLYDSVLPQSSPRRAFPRLTTALVHLRQGKAEPAAEAAGQAVEILTRTLPEGDFVTAIGRCLLGEALLDGAEVEQGRALISAALPVVERAPAEHAPYIDRCRAAAARVTPQQQR